ncbi:hypothetical protein Bca52824_092730 [Brassica carinata]|uniref:AAA ATPase AAA+ lid domain-containing protein n=1 Tax=Brassica carinata TaxID=52824 RepID=A0A8X7P3T4_BRACI|nr:hypothetical protein Bca52824_092730 [Brassica carinata]
MLELLNQLDGFYSRGDVKVILATNRIESLDPMLFFDLDVLMGRSSSHFQISKREDASSCRSLVPKFLVHQTCVYTSKINLEEFAMTIDELSGADIKDICTEAGLLALRERCMKGTHLDFKKAKEKVMFKKKENVPEGVYM